MSNCWKISRTTLAVALEITHILFLPLAQKRRNIDHIAWRGVAGAAWEVERLRIHAADRALLARVGGGTLRGLRLWLRWHMPFHLVCFVVHVEAITANVAAHIVSSIIAHDGLARWFLHDWNRRRRTRYSWHRACWTPGNVIHGRRSDRHRAVTR